MYDYDKNAQYNHMFAAMQHIRNLCEKRNMMISNEFSIEDYNIVSAEIRTACNMAKSFGCEIRLFQLDSFDVSPIIIIWVHNTCTGEVLKAAVRYVTEYGEIVSQRYYDDYHPYYLKREFNLPKGVKWYKVSWMIKRGGLKMAYCFIQAETAKAAREKFYRIAAKIDSKKKSFGLNTAHRFQIAVEKAAANDVDLSAVWKESGEF